MKDVRRLSDKVAKLKGDAAPIVEGQRDIAPPDANDRLAAVLIEVDETMLPRALIFQSDAGTLTMSAGNRRLISVDAATGEAADIGGPLFGATLSRPDVSELGRLRDTLVAAIGRSGPLTVKTGPSQSSETTLAAGTTAAALASAWGLDLLTESLDDAKPDTALETFLADVPTYSRAWLRLIGGSDAGGGGDDRTLKRLKTFADSADMADMDMQPDPKSRRFVAIGRSPDDGDCLIYVADQLDAALLMVPAKELDKAKEAWRSIPV